MRNVTDIFQDFLNLIYPDNCLGCASTLLKHEELICSKCIFSLPRTKSHDDSESLMNKTFWGRVHIESATSFCYFIKEGILQNMIHHLKYKGATEIGRLLGKHFGSELLESESFRIIDVIIPVPLHERKLKKRGYNQSECIAKGISDIMKIPVDSESVIRIKETSTQTKKSREARWENVEGIFSVVNPDNIKNKHVLIIDDVLTTGATLESLAATIIETTGTKVSIATLAYSSDL